MKSHAKLLFENAIPIPEQLIVAGFGRPICDTIRRATGDATEGELHYRTVKPCAKGSRSSMKIVLIAVIRAQPEIEGMIASRSPTFVSPSTHPVKIDPMIDSCLNPSPTCSRPFA